MVEGALPPTIPRGSRPTDIASLRPGLRRALWGAPSPIGSNQAAAPAGRAAAVPSNPGSYLPALCRKRGFVPAVIFPSGDCGRLGAGAFLAPAEDNCRTTLPIATVAPGPRITVAEEHKKGPMCGRWER